MGFGLDMQLRWTTHQHADDPDRLIAESASCLLFALARAFAAAAETELRAGEAYLQGRYEKIKSLKIANVLRRTIPQLRKSWDLFETYDGIDDGEMERAAMLAASRGELQVYGWDPENLAYSRLLRALAPGGQIANCVDEWRTLCEDRDTPPPEFVAFHLFGHLGDDMDDETIPELAVELVAAFPEAELTVDDAVRILEHYEGCRLTHEAAAQIAAAAVSIVESVTVSGSLGIAPAE